MSEAEVIHLLVKYHEGLFPKTCANCGRNYSTLGDYMLNTKPLWPATSYDAEMGRFDVTPDEQLGGIAMVNCSCGSTMALSTIDMPNAQMRLLLDWGRAEMKRQGMNQNQILAHLRAEYANRFSQRQTVTTGDRFRGVSRLGRRYPTGRVHESITQPLQLSSGIVPLRYIVECLKRDAGFPQRLLGPIVHSAQLILNAGRC